MAWNLGTPTQTPAKTPKESTPGTPDSGFIYSSSWFDLSGDFLHFPIFYLQLNRALSLGQNCVEAAKNNKIRLKWQFDNADFNSGDIST